MDEKIFLGISWDYFDWIKVDKKEIERRVRLELNEWNKEILQEYKGVVEEIIKEVEKDIKFLE